MAAPTPPPDPTPPAPAPASPRRRQASLRRAFLGAGGYLLSVLALLGLLAGGLWWLLRTEPGTAWLLARVPGVQVVGGRGSVLGDFAAQSIELPLPGEGAGLRLQDFSWRGLRFTSAGGPLWLRMAVDELRAARVDLRLGSGSSDPLQAPASLALPVEVELGAVRVAELHIDALGEEPLRGISAKLHLGADGGASHRLDDLRLEWERLRVAGSAQVATGGELVLQAHAQLIQPLAEGGQWNASAQLTGPLAAPQLKATLRAQPTPSRPAQSLDVEADLRPFAAWPLGALQASASGLDLSALHPSAPATTLDLDASASTLAMDQPAAVRLVLHNRRAGLWNEGRLPLRELKLDVSARPDDPRQLELQHFEALLGTSNHSAGRVSGSGRFNPAQWSGVLKFIELQPSRLDARAPDMQLGGQLALDGRHFDTAAAEPAQVDAKGEIRGQLLGLSALPNDPAAQDARRVQLSLDGRWRALRIDLREAVARAGSASATLSGQLSRPRAGAPWSAKGQAELNEFDPLPWWPGSPDSPWRQGPHRLNAHADFDLQLPAGDASRSAPGLLGALRGDTSIDVEPSRLAGVPLSGSLKLKATPQGPAEARLQLLADGNSLRADARLASLAGLMPAQAPAAAATDDRWTLQADMPALNRLTPLWRLLQGGRADARLAGSLSANAEADGRWPALGSSGKFDASALRLDALSVQRAQVSWSAGSQAGAPLQVQVDLDQLAYGQPSVEALKLRVTGTRRAHRIDLSADAPALPPAWVETVQPASAGSSRSLALLQAQGGLSEDAAQRPIGWRGSLQRFDLRGDAVGAQAWASARDIAIDGQWGGPAPRLAIAAGRAEVLGAGISFSRITWRGAEAGGAPAALDAQVQLEPLAVAPLLNRLQPGFGWGGDLRLSGHVQVQSAPAFVADVVLERSSGDLSVQDDSGLRHMGLSDLRVGLNASDGVWNFFMGLAGKTLGTAVGAVVARTGRNALWPAPPTPIEGVLDLQVADLGVWGPWLPPGWRLEGAIRGNAAIGGRFGAPEYTGEIAGSGVGVRNVLQGVQVREGDIAIALHGDSARIERFTARAGNGSLNLQGDASLGETPRAELQLVLDKFQLLGRVDRRIVTSGQTRLVLGKNSLALDGEVTIDEGRIDFTRSNAPTLSSDVQVSRGKTAADKAQATDSPGAAAPASARQVSLNLRVLLGDNLHLRGQGLDADLRGDLRLTAPGGRLRVDGSVQAVNGTYTAYRQNLQIDRGVLTFNGPVENPQLDIEATRPNLDVRVGVAVTGTVLVPRIRLFSDTPMSDAEKLSWLLRGRASEGSGADTALLQAAALALASGDEPGALDQIMRTIGVDDFSLRDADGTGGGTVVSVGKQLSRNWYLGYERGLNAAAGNWQLIYRVAQRFTVRAQSGDENSIALIWTWRWQ